MPHHPNRRKFVLRQTRKHHLVRWIGVAPVLAVLLTVPVALGLMLVVMTLIEKRLDLRLNDEHNDGNVTTAGNVVPALPIVPAVPSQRGSE